MEFKLTKPIVFTQEEISTLDIREPTAKEVKRLGLPIDIEAKGINTACVHAYLVELCALPPSVIDQLSARDFTRAAVVVAGFFGEAES